MCTKKVHVLFSVIAESQPLAPSRTKVVLVCFGERKRPVMLPKDANINDLKLSVVREYSDVLQCSSTTTDDAIASSLFLQIKAECWDGVFVDVKLGDETNPFYMLSQLSRRYIL